MKKIMQSQKKTSISSIKLQSLNVWMRIVDYNRGSFIAMMPFYIVGTNIEHKKNNYIGHELPESTPVEIVGNEICETGSPLAFRQWVVHNKISHHLRGTSTGCKYC